MSTLTTATIDDLAAIQDLFARVDDVPSDLALVAEEKCFAPGFRGPARVRSLSLRNQIKGVAVTCGRHLRILVVDQRERGNGIGSALLADSEEQVRSAGFSSLEVASEAGNYFTPGTPLENTRAIQFLEWRGFIRSDEALNLQVSLQDNPLIPSSSDFDDRVTRGNAANRSEVTDFIDRHFGPIWKFEVDKAFNTSPPTVFVARLDGAIAGFSAHDVNNRGLGFFGPEGVDSSVRNQGFGRSLLLASLADLRARGFRQSTIPWASSVDFYARSCGAEVSGRFAILAKRLEL